MTKCEHNWRVYGTLRLQSIQHFYCTKCLAYVKIDRKHHDITKEFLTEKYHESLSKEDKEDAKTLEEAE